MNTSRLVDRSWMPRRLGVMLVAALCALAVVLRRGARWRATDAECQAPMPGDEWLSGRPGVRVRMTRAVTIDAPIEEAWLWLAQLGRGAGWYSVDRLDNGGRTSARHLVSWIPAPELGDATAIGYLRDLDPGRELAWWIPDGRLLGARFDSVMSYRMTPLGSRCRVTTRCSWNVDGATRRLVVPIFQLIDTVMMRRQLLNLRRRVELGSPGSSRSELSETGERDQYQLYEVIYASGARAGLAEKEEARQWRRAAIRDGVLAVG